MSKIVSYPKLLLVAPIEEKGSGLQRVITGDKLRFVLDYPRGSIWAASVNELPQRIEHKIDTEKCLVSIL
jgi:hypothetical protein